jgi:putative ABC transport system permease protein
VGVLETTGTPHDNAIFCDLKSMWDIHKNPSSSGSQRNLSSILLLLQDESYVPDLLSQINSDVIAQAVKPSTGIRDLQNLFGNVQGLVIAISYLVLLAAGISIFVSLYNSMADRRREIAIVRALGAPSSTIFLMIVLESATICLIGGVAGIALTHAGIFALQSVLRDMTGLVIFAGLPGVDDVLVIAGALVLGIVSAVIPAINAYRTDIATHIRPVA